MTVVRQVGERVEELLASLMSGRDRAAAEELIGTLVGLYGDGLARIMTVLADRGQAGAEISAALADDPLVSSLLLLHDLHPVDLDTRVQRALDQVRPYLGSHAGGVQYIGVTDGVARLRLEGSCHGCPSSTVTVKLAIEGAVRDAAPEIDEVVVEGMTEPAPAGPALLQIGRPPADREAGILADAPANGESVWITLPDIGPPSSRPVAASAGHTAVVICAVRGTLYAYRDACAQCGLSLADGVLERERLTCPGCGTAFDVRLAGRGIDDPALHLDPLPLLSDSIGVRVALPEGARA